MILDDIAVSAQKRLELHGRKSHLNKFRCRWRKPKGKETNPKKSSLSRNFPFSESFMRVLDEKAFLKELRSAFLL